MQFRCLGPLRVTDGERELPLGAPKQRLVLATLVMHAGEEVAADRLVDAVWNGDRPASGRASLHTYVSHLRKVVGPERLVSRGRAYRLAVSPGQVDALQFERLLDEGRRQRHDPDAAAQTLRAALELWTGPAYADLADAPALQAEITRLEELRLVAVEERIAADLDGQMDAELVGELEALLTEHPLRERLWAALMLALYRSGRQGDALGAYERARDALVEGLGVDPSPDLQRMQAQILRQDPTLRRAVANLKGYRLLERIEEGRWWTHWRGSHPGSDAELLVRVAVPHLADDAAFIRAFTPRMQRIRDVAHPHLSVIHDFWREPGTACVVERGVPGRDLVDVLATEPDRTTRERLARQLTEALAAAHRRGVVHGALTPGAVRVDTDGRIVLTGFAVGPTDGRADGGADGAAAVPGTGLHTDVHALGVILAVLLPEAADLVADMTATDADRRPADATEVLAQLTVTVPHSDAAPDSGVGARANPYKGLHAFTETDRDDFFGRQDAVARLLAVLGERTVVTVVGPSGSGKSSVVRAGLVPALRDGVLPGSADWYIASMLPGDDPFESLASALRQVAVDPPGDLVGLLRARGLPATAAAILPDDHDLLLILDQMEELFTLADDAVRQRFTAMLADAAAGRRIRIVATLRADFYDRPLADPALAPLVRDGTSTIVPMTATEIEQAVRGPAARVGLEVDGALVTQMVADVVDQPGALPLVQYALTELCDRTEGRALTLDGYRQIGGVTGALARRAEDAWVGLSPAGRQAARQLLLRLVSPGPHGERTRTRVLVDDVTTVAPNEIPQVLRALGAARLLTFDRDPDSRAPTVEVAHEALLREWVRLRQWVTTAEQHIVMQRRLQRAAADWAAADRDPSYLATGSQLTEYEAWRDLAMTPTANETAYLDASLAHREQVAAAETERRAREDALEVRSNRRLRVLVGVLAVAAVVGGVLTVSAVTLAGRAADRAQVANARELAAGAMANREADPERSLLLALEAVEASRSTGDEVLPEAQEALHAAITASRVSLRVPSHSGLVDWHPDGTRFVMEGADAGHVEVRDAATGALLTSWVARDGPLRDLVYAPDGSVVATAGGGGHLKVWDAAQELIADLSGGDGPVTGVSISADGGLLAAAWPDDDVVRAIALPSGDVVQEIFVEAPTATSFARNGGLLAVSRRFGTDLFSSLDDEATRALYPEASWTGQASFRARPTGGGERWKPADQVRWQTPHVAFGQDGRYLLFARENAIYNYVGSDDTPRIWFRGRDDAHRTAGGGTAPVVAGDITTLDWADDGPALVTASRDGLVQVWTVDGTWADLTATISSVDTLSGLSTLALDAGAQRLLIGSTGSRSVAMWDLTMDGTAHLANMQVRLGASGASALGGGRVMIPGVDDVASVRDSSTWQVVDRLGPGQVPDRIVTADPDGRLVAAILSSQRVGVYAAGTDEPLWTIEGWGSPRRSPTTVAVSADANRVLVQDETGAVGVYDRAGELVAELGDPDGVGGSLATGGDRVVAAQEVGGVPTVTVWDIASSRQLARFEEAVTAVDVSDDGALVAIAGEARVAVRDLGTRETLAALPQPSGAIAAVAISPSGGQVMTGSADGLVRVFDLVSGAAPVVLRGHDAAVTTVAWASGDVVVSGDASGLYRSWATDVDAAVEIARQELTRGFTDDECRRYLRLEACPAR